MAAFLRSEYRVLLGMGAMVSVFVIAGCSQQTEPAPAEPVYRPQPVDFSKNKDVVENPAAAAGPESRKVVADFNLDGKDDLVLLNKHSDGTTEVEIFIRQPSAPGDASGEVSNVAQNKNYYRAGVIQGTASGKIIGIASQRKGAFTDLRVIIETPGQAKNVHVLYRNNGRGFFQVEEL